MNPAFWLVRIRSLYFLYVHHVTCIFKETFKEIFSVNVWLKCTWKKYLTQLWFICFVSASVPGDPPDIVQLYMVLPFYPSQRPRMDLDKRFLPRPNTTTA